MTIPVFNQVAEGLQNILGGFNSIISGRENLREYFDENKNRIKEYETQLRSNSEATLNQQQTSIETSILYRKRWRIALISLITISLAAIIMRGIWAK